MEDKKKNKQESNKHNNSEKMNIPLGKDDGIVTDPFGSYTGVSEDGETPIQDADDL